MQFGNFTPIKVVDKTADGDSTDGYLFAIDGYEISVLLTTQALMDAHDGYRNDAGFEVDTWEAYVTWHNQPLDFVATMTNSTVPEWLAGNVPAVGSGFFKNLTAEGVTDLLTQIEQEAQDVEEGVA